MKLVFLQTFLLTVDAGSMAEAARRLDMTAAAVAQQLRSLENDIGARLVRRVGKTVRPTDAGHRILERARALVHDAAHMKALANLEDTSGELRIGAINTAMSFLIPEALACLIASFPDLRFHIRSALSAELFDSVQRGELDAAVCLHPQFVLPKTFCWELLREEALVALVPPELADCDPHELLRTKPFIRYDRNQWGGQQVDRYLKSVGIVPRERVESSQLTAIATLVARGLGVALIPDVVMPDSLRLKTATLPLSAPHKPRQFGVLWQRSSMQERLIKRFVDQLQALSIPFPKQGLAGRTE